MDLIHAAYEPEGAGPHPTVIALHGWGANALDLLGLAPHLCDGKLLVLCPQGPLDVPIGPGMNGYGWFPITMGAPPDPAAFARAVDALDAFLAAAQRRYPINPDRLAVLGFSQGGAMAYALALRHGRALAAVAALSTWYAPGLSAMGSASLAGLPVLVQHGTRDELIDVSVAATPSRRCARRVPTCATASTRWGTRSVPPACATWRAFSPSTCSRVS
jgi:phospholipase/carboxylesterase